MPKHGGIITCLESDLAVPDAWRAVRMEVKTGNKRRPEVEGHGLGTHILLNIVLSYFFWLCPEYLFLHFHLSEDHHFLRDTAQIVSRNS